MKVLVVDDDPCTLNILAEYLGSVLQLEAERIEVLVARDGFTALELAKQCTDVNCILMDYHMPVMDGCSCIRAIRQLEHLRQTRIFLMSAEWPAQKQADQLGVGFIRKPFDLANLVDRLRGTPRAEAQVVAA